MAVSDRPQLDDPSADLRTVVGAATDVGGRTDNEDMVHVGMLPPVPHPGNGETNASGAPGYVLAVADGMGGHQRGEVASRLAIETIARMFDDDPDADAALLLKQAFRRANEAIYEDGRAGGDEQLMGTTLTVAVLRGKYATIASIGDSRAYLARANQLTQITKDHSLVAEQVSQGTITANQARESPHRNILTHALGHRAKLDAKVPGIFELTLLPEDRLLLCTDGFYDVVQDQEIVEILMRHAPEDAAKRLFDLAVERGRNDNVSAVVAEAVPTRESVGSRETLGAGARIWVGHRGGSFF